MEQFLTPSPALLFASGKKPVMAEFLNRKAALIIAHPGHELCVHGWLTLAKPVVFVLADGSGRTGRPRLASTARILSQAGARQSAWFGKHTDQVIYQALLRHDTDFFCDLAIQLADALETADVDYVVGDSLEGYNPTHDICRMLLNTAVMLVNQRYDGRKILNYDFPIIGLPRSESVTLQLDEASFQRKTDAMRSYPELADEVSVALDSVILKKLDGLGDFGREIKDLIQSRGAKDFFRQESFWRVSFNGSSPVLSPATMTNSHHASAKPYYERYAEILVAAGAYQQVIRYVDHVAPVAEALGEVTLSNRYSVASRS